MQILLAEADVNLTSQLGSHLAAEGHSIECFDDGDLVLRAVEDRPYDALVLGTDLPARDGIAVCQLIRGRGDMTPVLLLADRDAPMDRIRGLDAGADDCLAKPFNYVELAARLRAITRRHERPALSSILQVGDITLDLLTRHAYRGERAVELTTREFMLLESFLRHPNQVLTRSQLLSHVWGLDYLGASNVVDVYVRYLRGKLGKTGETRLETVRGAGYRLRAPRDAVIRPGSPMPQALAAGSH